MRSRRHNVGTYALVRVDNGTLPNQVAGCGCWMLSGSLALQGNGYYLRTWTDSALSGKFAHSEGRRLSIDGSLITLADTTESQPPPITGAIDAYTITYSVPSLAGVTAYRCER